MYKIETNIPMPSNATKKPKYPFGQMAVGDSFLVETNTPNETRKKLAAIACMYAKRKGGIKFRTHVSKEGVRIWRVE